VTSGHCAYAPPPPGVKKPSYATGVGIIEFERKWYKPVMALFKVISWEIP